MSFQIERAHSQVVVENQHCRKTNGNSWHDIFLENAQLREG
jgi:hypothetical protein